MKTCPDTVSIGFTRDDGDFQILATLNNNDGKIGHTAFLELIQDLSQRLAAMTFEPIEVLERQDAPDYITPEGAEQ